MTPEDSDKVYERYAIPATGHVLFEGGLANFSPGSALSIDYKKAGRAPLLFIAGGSDHIIPATLNRSNAKLYRKSDGVVDYKEFPGRAHYIVGQDGWEEVADYALDWATKHAAGRTAAAG
jgi:predicted esterase